MAGVCAVVLCAAGCGGGGAGKDGTDRGRGEASPATTAPAPPIPASPVPRGKGGKVPDDVNGDGHPDLAYLTSSEGGGGDGDAERNSVVIVYGSAEGLDPATRTVLKPEDPAVPAESDTPLPSYPVLADLDADGYADLKFGEHVVWSGPTGPDPKTPDTTLPAVTGTPGDFDGDGLLDLPAVEDTVDRPQFRIRYGPFDRSGEPARTGGGRPGPVTGLYATAPYTLHAGDADGDRTADLVAAVDPGATDGGQAPAALLHAGDGPAGFATRARQLGTGSAVALGDFDGDEKGDVVIGDDGSRNYEADGEAPGVNGTFTVFPGDGGPSRPYELDLVGDLVTGDLDGDGRDELLVDDLSGGLPLPAKVTVVRGLLGSRSDVRTSALDRFGPARVPGAKRDLKKPERYAHIAAVRDFDGDGRAEVVLRRTTPERGPTYIWVVDGDGKDLVTFDDGRFTGTG
ncbi:VCBS repeat-containing protein [Streptomyces sp. NPDC020766]|uniref:VCBS repeat-containing protein n=1 Tax=Streptomyces sp. NPDC020766 TaxID=3155011 RepID=UPI0033F0E4E2